MTSVSALLKSLRGDDETSKINTASEAWKSETVYIPRKADVLRDWIVDAWLRQPSLLVDSAYQQLFLEVSPHCVQPSQPPLSLFAAFFRAVQTAGHIPTNAASVFKLLYESRMQKAEAWVEVWTTMIELLAVRPQEPEHEELIAFVCREVRGSLLVSQNGKKIAQSLYPLMSTYAKALKHHPVLQSLTGGLLLPTAILQLSNPLSPMLSAFSDNTDTSLVVFLPHLFQTCISRVQTDRHALFNRPSSSRTPYDVYIADRVRETIRMAFEDILAVLDSTSPQSWQSRLAVWRILEDWGGYLETDHKWGDVLAREATRAEETLVQPGLAEVAISILVILETLDHGRANVDAATLGWCLAAPKACHEPSSALLSAILRYHTLTHSLDVFARYLCEAIDSLFPEHLPDEAVRAIYQLAATGPLTTATFNKAFLAAVRVGRGDRIIAVLLEHSSPMEIFQGKKRRRENESRSAARTGLTSRLLAPALVAGEGGLPIGLAEAGLEMSRKTKRHEWTADVAMAAAVRNTRFSPEDDAWLVALCRTSCLSELRFEIVSNLARSSESKAFANLLVDLLVADITVPWTGKAAMTDAELPAALWELSAGGALTLVDRVASPDQIRKLSENIAYKLAGGGVGAQMTRQCLISAEIWELPNLRAAIHDSKQVLLTVLDDAPTAYTGNTKDIFETILSEKHLSSWATRCAGQIGIPVSSLNTQMLRSLSTAENMLGFLHIAYKQVVQLDRDLLGQLVEDAIQAKPFAKLAKTIKKTGVCPVDSVSRAALLLAQVTSGKADQVLTKLLTENIMAAVHVVLKNDIRIQDRIIHLWQDASKLPGYQGNANLEDRLVRAIVRAPANLDATSAFEIIAVNSGVERLLAVFIALYEVAPSPALVDSLATHVSRWSSDAFSSAFAQVISRGHIVAICVMLEASNKGSGKIVSFHCHALLSSLFQTDVYSICLTLRALSEHRARALRQPEVMQIWLLIRRVVSPEARASYVDPRIFPLLAETIVAILRTRGDLVLATMPLIVDVIRALFPLFQAPRRSYRTAVKTPRPSWMGDDGLDANDARSVSKLMETLARVSAGPLAKHAPSMLVGYVRAASEPYAGLSSHVRKELEPGLFALCEVISAGGRGEGRGREGEGVGLPFGLGDGGQAEVEFWADMWTAWSKRRYAGQG